MRPDFAHSPDAALAFDEIYDNAEAEAIALRAEVRHLRLRLAAAEQVCTIYGWCSADTLSEVGKAVTQAWMDWVHEYGSPLPSPAWNERIRVLAKRRDEIREHTLAKLREKSSAADAAKWTPDEEATP